MSQYTTISIRPEVKAELYKIASKQDTWDDVLLRLLKEANH